MQKIGAEVKGIFLCEKYRFADPLEKADTPIIVDVCKNFGTISGIIASNTESGLDAYNETFNDVNDFILIGPPDDEYVDSVSFVLERVDGSCTITINLLVDLICFSHFKSEDLGIDQFAEYLEKELKKRKKTSE